MITLIAVAVCAGVSLACGLRWAWYSGKVAGRREMRRELGLDW